MKPIRKYLALFLLGLTALCLVTIAGFALSNLGLSQHSPVLDQLSDPDKLRLAETLHLRQAVGDAVWPGWGRANIPAILYNEEYVFLVGYPEPADGWIKVPANQQRGGPWELAPGADLSAQAYYRQRLADPNITPQAFTVQVGERWASSLTTYDWMKISMRQTIQQDLPAFLRPIFPYQLFMNQLLGGSDKYISLTAHEAFHAYQGMLAPDKLTSTEQANSQDEDLYPWDDASLRKNWQAELDLLAKALRSSDQAESAALARQFLVLRYARRASAGLDPQLIEYEKHREWLEGLARYAELEIWRQASTETYTPLQETSSLPDFDRYTGFSQRWSQELDQLGRMAGDRGDGRFYYTGMAQAYLLDRLMPGWKARAFDPGVWLDDLLTAALGK